MFPRNPNRPLALSNYSWSKSPNPPILTLDVQSLLKKREQMTNEWKETRQFKEYKDFFEGTLLKLNNLKITNCLCLGLGSMSEVMTNICWQDSSMAQLVLFESLIQLLKTKHEIQQIYFQDPAFVDQDLQFFEKLGYAVGDTPKSDDLISDTTFVFAPNAEAHVINSSVDVAHPSIFFSGCDLTRHYEYIPHPGSDQGFPFKPDKDAREARKGFLSKRARKNLPFYSWKISPYPGPTSSPLYYKPDNESDIGPVKFEYEEHECFTHQDVVVNLLRERFSGGSGDT